MGESVKKCVPSKSVITCAICEGTFKNMAKFKTHLAKHKKPYKCQYCGMEYEIYHFFKNHKLTHVVSCGFVQAKKSKNLQNVTTYKCHICEKEYIHKKSLQRHILWHKGIIKKVICNQCGKSFNDTTNLKSHQIAVHDKIKPYKCTICPRAYAGKMNLKIHFRKHTGERPYKCTLCPDSFICSSDLGDHKKKHFLPPIDPNSKYVCKTCHAPFEHKGLYLSHIKTHVKLEHLKCSICDKDFSCKYSLSRHALAHTGLKSHRCGICNQEFTYKTQLVRHEKRFHDPNPIIIEKVKCLICGKYVSNMENHTKIHYDRPYACKSCDKTYADRHSLIQHVKGRHSGGKPYPCGLCDKTYIKKLRLKDHMTKVHKTPLVLN